MKIIMKPTITLQEKEKEIVDTLEEIADSLNYNFNCDDIVGCDGCPFYKEDNAIHCIFDNLATTLNEFVYTLKYERRN